MKKMFLATCLLAASAFAAPNDAPKAAAPAAQPAAEAPKAEAAAPAAQPAAAQPAAQAAAAQPVAQPAAQPAAEAKAEAAPAEQPAAEAKAETAAPAPATDSAAAQSTEAVAAADSAAAPEVANEAAPAAEVAAAEQEQKPAKKKKRKKKKMIKKPVVETQSLAFDIQADFELEAGKVFWATEDDPYGDNLETWNGEANFAVLAEGEDFKGKIGIAFYPGDLRMSDDNIDKRAKKEALRNETEKGVDDYFSLDEAWAMQNTDYFVFKVGRWDNTDKNGDYFGGYVDGYMNGFMSTQPSENQLQFGFTPTEHLDFFLSLISKSPNLDKGDLRAAFNFHGLESINNLNVQLAYRSNVFDLVYDPNIDVVHNASVKFNLPVLKDFFNIFAEAALMNIDPNEDMVIPVTGGIAFETKVVDRIILEGEWIKDRHEYEEYQTFGAKHVKDVLGAIYLEKAFTDRFSLSAGFHSYGSTKDYMLSGNLVGRIN